MTGFGKAVVSALLAALVVVEGPAYADDKQTFDLDAIEVAEDREQAILAMDVPNGSEVKTIDNPERGEMTVTFTGVSVRLPKRVHSGEASSLLSSVDVEPWFIDGERVTRMVIRYPEGAKAIEGREGDVLLVTIEAPESASEPRASFDEGFGPGSGETALETFVAAHAGPAESDDVDDGVVPEVWSMETDALVSAPPPALEPIRDTAPVLPPASHSRETADADEAPRSGSGVSTASAPPAPAPAAAVASAPAPAAAPPVWYGEQAFLPVDRPLTDVSGWPLDGGHDLQPELPDLESGPTITIDLQGADVLTVLRSLSDTSGWNIVANADVHGTVSLKLSDVPWRKALSMVLKTQGLGYVVEDGIIRVARADALRAEVIARESAARKKDELVPLETSVVPIKFAAASEILLSIQTLLSPRGRIKEDARTNALIVTDIPTVLPQVTDLVQKLDGRTPQVEIVAKLVDIDVSAVREMGINWGLTNLHSTSQALSGNASVTSPVGAAAGTVNFGIIRDFADLDLTLQALEQNQRANIISNPKISTVNNREARILVGQEIPLIVMDEAGNPITELKKIGIELRVTPYINQDGLVTLDLHPEVSDLASQSTQQGGVIINTSEADTRVMVANGETAVIGGLIRANQTTFKTGVPVLHKLPIIGALFGSESKADAKRELVIFVTPRIIE